MKSEPKAFASLSSGLLARKGAARPAMRPQGFGQTGAGLEDLGWNDMGFEAPKPAIGAVRDASHDAFGDEVAAMPSRNPLAGLTPIVSPVHSQQAEIADRLVEAGDYEVEEDVDDTAEIYEPDMATVEEAIAEPTIFVAEAVEYVPEPQLLVENEPVSAVADEPLSIPATALPAAEPRRIPKPRAAPGSKAKAAFTLRLDPDRHLKLRLACAVDGRSAQQLVTDALDKLLAGMPELDAMATRANRKGS